MTGTGEGGGNAALATDEQFLTTVTSENVLEGWEELQALFGRFLGGDTAAAWSLVEVTHRPQQLVDEEGKPTGEWELVSSGTWKRDPEQPTPVRELEIVAELPELAELEG